MTNGTLTIWRRTLRLIAVAVFSLAIVSPALAQSTAATSTPPPAPAQDDDPDRDINLAQPDFALAALPTTLRVPRHGSSFRVTHRFGRTLGQGDFGDLIGDLFGLDGGALIGLEYRFGLFRRTQVGLHRTSLDKTIEFFGQRELVSQESFPLKVDFFASIDGTNNFRDKYTPALAVLFSREVGDYAAFYLEPMWVNNSNPDPDEIVDDNDTVMIGLGTRLRIRPTVYVVLEGAPRVSGYRPGVSHISFGIEKRAGGHLFQLNFSNGFGTTMGQLARGGTSNDDWYLGFNISRKFF